MANPALLRMLGYARFEDLALRNSEQGDFVGLHRRPGFKAIMEREGSVVGIESRWTRRDGTFIWVREGVRAVRCAEGTILYYDGTAEDISVRKRSEEEAIRSCNEKEALFRELQHRIKNSMATIVGLINMEAGRWDDGDIRSMLQTMGDRVRSIASLYSVLHASGSSHLVHLDEYLERITHTLLRAYMPDQGRVTCDVTAEAVVVSTQQAVPIGLIANELVTNSLKHAFPMGCKGHISITLHQEGTMAVLSVCDDGVGLPEGFDISQSKGMGTELVLMLTEQLNGSISSESYASTVFRLVFPIVAGGTPIQH